LMRHSPFVHDIPGSGYDPPGTCPRMQNFRAGVGLEQPWKTLIVQGIASAPRRPIEAGNSPHGNYPLQTVGRPRPDDVREPPIRKGISSDGNHSGEKVQQGTEKSRKLRIIIFTLGVIESSRRNPYK
jgi:hypothetical protein